MALLAGQQDACCYTLVVVEHRLLVGTDSFALHMPTELLMLELLLGLELALLELPELLAAYSWLLLAVVVELLAQGASLMLTSDSLVARTAE